MKHKAHPTYCDYAMSALAQTDMTQEQKQCIIDLSLGIKPRMELTQDDMIKALNGLFVNAGRLTEERNSAIRECREKTAELTACNDTNRVLSQELVKSEDKYMATSNSLASCEKENTELRQRCMLLTHSHTKVLGISKNDCYLLLSFLINKTCVLLRLSVKLLGEYMTSYARSGFEETREYINNQMLNLNVKNIVVHKRTRMVVEKGAIPFPISSPLIVGGESQAQPSPL